MSKIVDNVVVFGGGAWGTALAKTISQNVEQVFIYLRDPELINEINQKHTNYAKLGSVELPKNIIAIEWPEKIKKLLPKKVINIEFKFLNENEREIRIKLW